MARHRVQHPPARVSRPRAILDRASRPAWASNTIFNTPGFQGIPHKYPPDTPGTFQISHKYFTDTRKYSPDTPQILPKYYPDTDPEAQVSGFKSKYFKNTPQILPRYYPDTPKIPPISFSKYSKNTPQILPRYSPDTPGRSFLFWPQSSGTPWDPPLRHGQGEPVEAAPYTDQ